MIAWNLRNAYLYEPDPDLDARSRLIRSRRLVAATIQPQAGMKGVQALLEATGANPSPFLDASSTIVEAIATNPSLTMFVDQVVMEVIIFVQQQPYLIVPPPMARLRRLDIDHDDEVMRPHRSFALGGGGGLIDYAISVIT